METPRRLGRRRPSGSGSAAHVASPAEQSAFRQRAKKGVPHLTSTHTQVHGALERMRVCTFELQSFPSVPALIVNSLWFATFR